MDKLLRAQMIIAELRRRGELPVPKTIFLDHNFPKQYAAALDKSFLKGVQCTRRAGKSTGEGKETLQEAWDCPGTKHLYGALTLSSSKNIIWDTLLDELDNKKIKHSPNSQQGIIKLDNKSEIKLFGLDSSYKEMRKILGSKYKTVKIDEAGSITQDLKKICYQMILPALTDVNGRLTLLGTAENIPKTFFEAVTSGAEPGWSIHKWTAFDNPYIAEKWQKHIEWIQQNNPSFMLTSEYKTHYLNEWCADDKLLIIKINENTVIPAIELINPTYILGVDLGYNDDCSFVLTAFHSKSPDLYVVEAAKEKELDITETANRVKEYLRRFPIAKVVMDGANKQGVMEIRNRHNVPVQIAEKSDKASFLKILADDITRGRVKYFEGKTQALIDEQQSLQWKDETKQDEDPRIANHCFVGGTQVLTINGYKPIERIDIGELVMTRKGFMPVMVKHESLTDEIMVIHTKNGIIQCTPNHKFMTNNNWVEASSLTTDAFLYMIGSWKNQNLKNLNTTGLYGGVTLTQKVLLTENTGKDSLWEKLNICTGMCGKKIMARYRRAITFITKITTLTITALKILKLCVQKSIQNTICNQRSGENTQEKSLSLRLKKLRSGTDHKTEKNGTPIIGKKQLVKSWKILSSYLVKFVARKKKLSLSTKEDLGGVALVVPRNLDVYQASIISQKSVSSVQETIKSIDTTNPSFALDRAILEQPIKKSELRRVYNLTVRDQHEYIVNGYLVKNCNDALLYNWREARNYLWREQEKPADINSDKYMDEFAKRLTEQRKRQNEY